MILYDCDNASALIHKMYMLKHCQIGSTFWWLLSKIGAPARVYCASNWVQMAKEWVLSRAQKARRPTTYQNAVAPEFKENNNNILKSKKHQHINSNH